MPLEVYGRWLPKVEIAENAYKRAADIAKQRKGELANVYKAAGQDGAKRESIKEYRRLEKLDATEVALFFRELGRCIEASPTSKLRQLDLFASLKLPDPVNPYLAGQQAGREGGPKEPPYALGTEDAVLWCDGYDNGQRANHDSLRQASEPEPAGVAHEQTDSLV